MIPKICKKSVKIYIKKANYGKFPANLLEKFERVIEELRGLVGAPAHRFDYDEDQHDHNDQNVGDYLSLLAHQNVTALNEARNGTAGFRSILGEVFLA
jgi:hypothetical protein